MDADLNPEIAAILSSDGGHETSWRIVSRLINALEEAAALVQSVICEPWDNEHLPYGRPMLSMVGSAEIGSIKFRLKINLDSDISFSKNKVNNPGGLTFSETVTTGIISSVMSAIIVAIGGAVVKDKSEKISKEDLVALEYVRAYRNELQPALSRMRLEASQAYCRSVTLELRSFSPVELVGKMAPLSLVPGGQGRFVGEGVWAEVSDPAGLWVSLGGASFHAFRAKRSDDGASILLIDAAGRIPKSGRVQLYETDRMPFKDARSIYIADCGGGEDSPVNQVFYFAFTDDVRKKLLERASKTPKERG